MTVPAAASSALVDTNLLLYVHDASDPQKQAAATRLLNDLATSGRLVLSAQILNESYWNATRPKLPQPLTHDEAVLALRDLAAFAKVVPLDAATTFLAVQAMVRHGLAFWDALVWAAAKQNGVGMIYTEDYQHGRDVEGIRYSNPFLIAPGP